MTTMLTNQFDKTAVDLSKNIKIIAAAQYKSFEKEWPMITQKESTDIQINKTMGYEGMGAAPAKAESATASQTRIYEGYVETAKQQSYVHEAAISWENRRFANANVKFTAMIGSFLARSGLLRYEYSCANVLNNGFSSTYPSGDGQAYFSAAHVWKSGGTFDNLLTKAVLSKTSIKDALVEVANAKMEQNIPAALKVKSIIISYYNILTLPEILKSTLDPDTANNRYNAIQDFNIQKTLNHYLSSQNAWFVDTAESSRVLYEASPIILDSYVDDSTNNMVERLWTSIGAGFHHMLRSFGNEGS